jgi:hypothetical protein
VTGRQARGLGLECRAGGEQLVDLVLGGDVHGGTEPRAQIDPALVVETLQSLADRLPGDVQHACELVLDEVLTATQ